MGNGTAKQARGFVKKFGITYPVYTDKTRKAFAAAGMKTVYGMGMTTFKAARRALKGGFRQGKTQGAPFQQGGIVLADEDGTQLFVHVDDAAGAHLSPQDVLDRIRPILGHSAIADDG